MQQLHQSNLTFLNLVTYFSVIPTTVTSFPMQGCLSYTDEWSPEAVILGFAFSDQNTALSFSLSYSANGMDFCMYKQIISLDHHLAERNTMEFSHTSERIQHKKESAVML